MRLPRVPRSVWIAIALVTLARIAYQIVLSPYELVADEAQYWDWSRRLDWSYYSKGPGIAWVIAASTRLFGISAWSVRLPAALAFAVVSAAVAHLALEISDEGTERQAAMSAVLLVCLVPAYQLSALLMTIDAPYIACWAAATWAAWRAYRSERDGTPSWSAWVGAGAAIGVGFLFKYTMVLFVPGLMALGWLERRRVTWRTARARAALAATVVATALLPVLIWNVRHEGASLRHLLGYLAANGGDQPARAAFEYCPAWTASLLGSQFGIVGPALAIVVSSVREAFRRADGDRDAVRFALCCAAPTVLFFFLASLRAPVQGNWPIAAYVSLLPICARMVARHARGLVRCCWLLTVAYGSITLAAIHAPLLAARAPVVGRYVPAHRFTGVAARVREFSGPIDVFRQRAGGPPLIIAPSHNAAALLAFYLPGRPRVASAGHYLGDRPSAYDFFPDVGLSSASNLGRPAVMIGATPAAWTGAFDLPDFVTLWTGREYATTRFGGPARGAPPAARH